MSDSISPLSREMQARQAIASAAAATGVDFSALVETARRESAFNTSARARTSSATGLFQFIDGTWLDMVRRKGAEHGLQRYAAMLQSGDVDAQTRREILDLRFDPEISARMAGELWRENAAYLENRIGRAPTGNELYAAHVLGPDGAARLVSAAATGAASAADLFPRAAAANRGLFYDRAGDALSAKELLQRLALPSGEGAIKVDAAKPEARVNAGGPATTPLSSELLHALISLLTAPSREIDGFAPQSDPWRETET
ncbi:MAG: transglycosylase SLT domain-containing protein [Hyphomonadaceae bacterium]|nr:transglycosylase SLT domain-containing protein [Hyphomonadaceae bacterium]